MAKRALPPAAARRQLLQETEYACAYCQMPFGTVVRCRSGDRITELNWDHFTPYAYLDSNPLGNWLASCNLCNNIKQDHHYDSIENARDDILDRWTSKGYEIQWVPPVSCEEDPHAWARAYSHWISS